MFEGQKFVKISLNPCHLCDIYFTISPFHDFTIFVWLSVIGYQLSVLDKGLGTKDVVCSKDKNL